MSQKIEHIEGIGESYGARLRAAGITTTRALLKACADRKGRKALAGETGLDEGRLLKWANMADLMRIKGIGKQFSELLEAAGVDTVKELRTRNAENLAAKMAEVNEQKKLTRAVPAEKMVAGWVEQAKQLPPAITY
ncbi:MAG: DUF4332 domain-containing protein [Geminicoccaceae bacterium]|nr:DUF4332 domain-containing protein [Geminicoccaceae bacterium]